MPDYNIGKNYEMECVMTAEIYIGSTCEPTLARRLAKHMGSYRSLKRSKGGKVASFDMIERGNYKIMLVENSFCNISDELTAREGYYIKEYK